MRRGRYRWAKAVDELGEAGLIDVFRGDALEFALGHFGQIVDAIGGVGKTSSIALCSRRKSSRIMDSGVASKSVGKRLLLEMELLLDVELLLAGEPPVTVMRWPQWMHLPCLPASSSGTCSVALQPGHSI